jgi:hypothetical protein
MTTQGSVALMGDCHLPRLGIFHPHTRRFEIDKAFGLHIVHVFRPHLAKRLRAQSLESSRRSVIAALPAALQEGKGQAIWPRTAL